MERFRQAVYKQKKLLDEILMMTNDDFIPQSLKFHKMLNKESGGYIVRLSLFLAERKPLEFRILS